MVPVRDTTTARPRGLSPMSPTASTYSTHDHIANGGQERQRNNKRTHTQAPTRTPTHLRSPPRPLTPPPPASSHPHKTPPASPTRVQLDWTTPTHRALHTACKDGGCGHLGHGPVGVEDGDGVRDGVRPRIRHAGVLSEGRLATGHRVAEPARRAPSQGANKGWGGQEPHTRRRLSSPGPPRTKAARWCCTGTSSSTAQTGCERG